LGSDDNYEYLTRYILDVNLRVNPHSKLLKKQNENFINNQCMVVVSFMFENLDNKDLAIGAIGILLMVISIAL
jgi:hypothetical protein